MKRTSKKRKKKSKKSLKITIKESLKISFLAMVFLFVAISFLPENFFLMGFMAVLWMGLVIAVFIMSIIHLNKYKQKSFAVISLVFSSIGILFILIAFFAIFAIPSYWEEKVLYNQNVSISDDLVAVRFFTLDEDGLLTINFSSDNFSDIYLFDETEYYRFMNNETSYYIEKQQKIKKMNMNWFLTKGRYVIVIFPSMDNESVHSSLYLSTTPYY